MLFEIAVTCALIFIAAKLISTGADLLALRGLVKQFDERILSFQGHVSVLRTAIQHTEQHAETLMRETRSWITESAAALEMSLYPPLLVLLPGEKPGLDTGWRIENHGVGPAVSVRCACVQGGQSHSDERVADSPYLTLSLPAGCALALTPELVRLIDDSVAHASTVATKAQELEEEGYSYKDLYGEDGLELRLILDYLSVKGKKYSTSARWLQGEMTLSFKTS